MADWEITKRDASVRPAKRGKATNYIGTCKITVRHKGKVTVRTFNGPAHADRDTALSAAINKATKAAEKLRDTGKWGS